MITYSCVLVLTIIAYSDVLIVVICFLEMIFHMLHHVM
jgi:hypothetical protein